MRARERVSVIGIGVFLGVAACQSSDARVASIRQGTLSYHFTITATQLPPHALDSVRYSIVVRDRKTNQPIQGGEGQIYAGHAAGPYTWDGLTYGPEIGTYHGWMRFAMAGTWDMHVRFRRDSLSPLEDTQWRQDVREQTPYVRD
jgi:hypothetical protein